MSTNLDSLFKNDTKSEESGVIFDIGNGVNFTLRRFGGVNSKKVQKAVAFYHKPYARLIELGTMDEKLLEVINIKVFCESCLVTWEGIEMDGQKLECNLDNAVKLFVELPELFATLFKHANDTANYKSDLGNS